MAMKPTHSSSPCYFLLAIFISLLAPSPSSCRIPTHHEHQLPDLPKGTRLSILSGGQVVSRPKTIVDPIPVGGRIKGEPGTSIEDLGHHAGFIKLPHATDSGMFYFFFESRMSKSDPVLLWITGWRASESSLFYENGPVHISDDNFTLTLNDFGWDKASNLIFVDQPTNIGFSYTSDESDFMYSEETVITDLYNFLQGFFKEHPKYAKNDFYIAGESHAGHFNPLLAERIREGNKDQDGIHINLKGFALGNALTSPGFQFAAYPDYALEKGLINGSDCQKITENILPECLNQTKLCNGPADDMDRDVHCLTAYHRCNWFFSTFLDYIERPLNYYDIRIKDMYDFSRMETLLNQTSVLEALGVPDNFRFLDFNPGVYRQLRVQWMENHEIGIPAMLEDGIKVLVYAGEFDLMYNWLGNWRWVHAMEWSGKEAFNASPNVSFMVDGKNAGLLKSHGPLAFLKVYDAGRMVPMDQPNVALEMVKKWVHGSLA